MLFSTKELDGFPLAARDGEIGHAREVYFDDQHWAIRHLVVDTGGWLSGRKVLVSPHAVESLDRPNHRIDVALRREQVEQAPDIDTERPVSRQQQMAYDDHYGYPYWWSGGGLWGAAAYPLAIGALALPAAANSQTDELAQRVEAERADADPHLRSSAEVIGYDIEARDGGIGHIVDFLFDERSWQIRFVVVDTRNWLPGRLVLIAPASIERIEWSGRRAHVRLSREAVKSSPGYDRGANLRDDDIVRIQRHYEGWQ